MSINTRLRRASFPLKPAPDIVWCPFPLRYTRNQHGLSAITTHLVSIVNAYKVYNNRKYSISVGYLIFGSQMNIEKYGLQFPRQHLIVCKIHECNF